MCELVRKRHDGDGWIVFSELGDAPGYRAKRHADAVALGVWASTKYECHLYEFKISREDVKREMRDPKKAEGVGKYCHYWWLAISDPKIINDLVIPEAFGIVTPKKHGDNERLTVLRKAPRLSPKPFGPMFAVSAIRNIRNGYIDPTEHDRVRLELEQIKTGPQRTQDEVDKGIVVAKLERELEKLKQTVADFEKASGVDLKDAWRGGEIGEAVATVMRWRDHTGERVLRNEIKNLSRIASELEQRAHSTATAAVTLRNLLASGDHSEDCPSRKWSRAISCGCGTDPMSAVEKQIAGTLGNPHAAAADDEAPESIEYERTVRQ